MVDKIVTLICLFGGFFWLRARARSINLENQIGKAVVGVFVLLPAVLFGEKYLFDNYHFGTYTDLLLKVALLLATFPAIGLPFLKPDPGAGPDPEAPRADNAEAPDSSR
ncbi:MAG TPA: hypothetical protein VJ385_19680 [Fibrobacteria bacterium]|nr:hypothetical protein [Fibrobacteria bacterium]